MFSDMKPAEKRLLEACKKGEYLFLGKKRPTEKTVENEIRGEFLKTLILSNNQEIEENGKKYILKINSKGIQFNGLYVSGNFDFSFHETNLAFKFGNSNFENNIDLSDSQIRFLSLSGSKISSLIAYRLVCKSDIILRNIEFLEKVDFLSAQVGGDLICRNGKFKNKDGISLHCNKIKIERSVFLDNGFESNGEVNFVSAQIGGDFNCRNGKFINENKISLHCNRMKIGRSTFLDNGFESNGEVNFVSAQIESTLSCKNAKFINEKEKALNCNSIKIGNAVFFNNLEVLGNLYFSYTQVENRLSLSKVDIKGKFYLTSAKVNTISIDKFNQIKISENIYLDGLVYEHLNIKNLNYKTLLDLLSKIPKEEVFKPQPYKQMAKVLRNMGHHEDANSIMIEYNNIITNKSENWFIKKLKQIYGITAGYGYKPMRVICSIFLVWLFCSLFYLNASKVAVFAPTNPLVFQNKEYKVKVSDEGTSIRDFFNNEEYKCEDKEVECNNWVNSKLLHGEYTTFNPFMYSLDVILPIVDLQVEKDWGQYVSMKDWTLNDFTRWLMWFEILFGWIYSLILVAILSGLAKNEKD